MFKVGDIVQMNEDAIACYGEGWAGVELCIVQAIPESIALDDPDGRLYTLTDCGEKLPFSVYGFELERLSR